MDNARHIIFEATQSGVEVSAILLQPPHAEWMFVLAHGAGAGMTHPFMETIATELATRQVATFRYQFPYMESGRWPPNQRSVLMETVRSAVREAHRLAPELRIVAGGKSMGGRMTSLACTQQPLDSVEGLVFLGFPLHPSGRESIERGEHLHDVNIPMHFVQGSRDRLSSLGLLRPLCASVGATCSLHVLEGGDHSFNTLKSSGRSSDQLMTEAADSIATWVLDL